MSRRVVVDEVIDVVPRRRLTRDVGRDERSVHSQWDAARAHLKRDEVSEAQWRTKMSLTTGPDADDHPHQAAAIYAQADYLLTHDSRGFPVGPLREQSVTVTSVDDSRALPRDSRSASPSVRRTRCQRIGHSPVPARSTTRTSAQNIQIGARRRQRRLVEPVSSGWCSIS